MAWQRCQPTAANSGNCTYPQDRTGYLHTDFRFWHETDLRPCPHSVAIGGKPDVVRTPYFGSECPEGDIGPDKVFKDGLRFFLGPAEKW